jgi:uncharacterized membrane protein
LSDLVVKDPPASQLEIFMGESKIIKYTVKNEGDFPIKDIEVTVKTVSPDGQITKGEYVELLKHPMQINPKQSGVIEIKCSVPVEESYIEKTSEGKLSPFRISVTAKGVKYIEEII